jgi:hypothetical protein
MKRKRKWPSKLQLSLEGNIPIPIPFLELRSDGGSYKSAAQAARSLLTGQRRGPLRRREWPGALLRRSKASSPLWLHKANSSEAPQQAPLRGRSDLLLVGSEALALPRRKQPGIKTITSVGPRTRPGRWLPSTFLVSRSKHASTSLRVLEHEIFSHVAVVQLYRDCKASP